MSTPFTITRLVRWRVKDWASCFYACRFPLDDREPEACCSSSMQETGENRRNEEGRGASSNEKCSQEREMVQSSAESSNTEEDYIVFCFREDGGIHVVEDWKSEASSNRGNKRSRPINSKLVHGGNVEINNISQQDSSKKDEENRTLTSEAEHTISDKKGEEEGSSCSDTKLSGDEIIEESHNEETKECIMVSAESSESNKSDASTGSFTFPILHLEWMGSPVQMPKSEDPELIKQKARAMRFHCCRF